MKKKLPPGKTLLTPMEENCLKSLQEHSDGYLRNYTEGQYRLQDSKINPIINIKRTIIESIVYKGYLQLLPEHKFKLL